MKDRLRKTVPMMNIIKIKVLAFSGNQKDHKHRRKRKDVYEDIGKIVVHCIGNI